MAQMHKSVATLRIIGDDLVPTDVSRVLNCLPTRAQKKGDVIVGKSGIHRIARTGTWSLESEDQQPEDLDGHIEEILGKLTGDMETWQSLARRFHLDLFCGLFMGGENEGLSISATSLLSLGQRGIELSLDVYGPD